MPRITAKTTNQQSADRLKELRLRLLESQTGLLWEAEFKFCGDRKWRFDFCCRSIATAIEIEGGVWTRGRHSRGTGMLSDMEKYNTAQLFGWIVLRYTPDQFTAGVWIDDVIVTKRRAGDAF